MQHRITETRITQPRSRRLLYRVVNHPEAGLFGSMAGLTLWALKNANDLDWTIGPASGKLPL